MPANKRQHYVPRILLKPFSVDGEGNAIHLYNIDRGLSIRGAAVKGQCARDYFYGEDLRLEQALQFFEAEYGRIVRGVLSGMEPPSDADRQTLRGFAHLQFMRTDMAIRRNMAMYQVSHDAMYEGRSVIKPELALTHRQVMTSIMSIYIEMRGVLEDLKICLIENATGIEFVTSDDPAVLANKFAAQRLGSDNFGLQSSGVILYLPLAPNMAVLAYDGQTYTIPDKAGHHLTIRDERDAAALNDLLYLKAAKNIYFRDWDSRGQVEEAFRETKARRSDKWFDVSVYVPFGKSDRGTKYRLATEEERQTAESTFMVHSAHYPIPATWLSKLKYRQPIQTHYNGSGAGHLRKANG